MQTKRPPNKPVTFEQVAARLSYNPETGVLTWKRRENAWKGWNETWAGKPAGSRGSGGEGYSYVTIDFRPRKAHRIAWLLHFGIMPAGFIDHINGDRLDNRIANLRLSTNAENMRNRAAPRNNSSGYKGVYLDAYTKRWKAQINIAGKNRNLGRFDTPEEAHAAYRLAAEQGHGAFARTE
jgi:hypothetical protein